MQEFSSIPALFAHCILIVLLITPVNFTAQDPTDDGDVIRVNTDLLLFPIRD